MKKIVLTIAALTSVSLAAYSQGQVGFYNTYANGYVVESSGVNTDSSATSYGWSSVFTAELYYINQSTLSGLPTQPSAAGYLGGTANQQVAALAADGFTAIGSSITSGSDGAFQAANNISVPGGASQSDVLAVVCWSGSYADLATAEAAGAYIGILAFVNAVGPAPPTPSSVDITTSWNALANSTLSAAEGGYQDLIMTQYAIAPVPEPSSLALAGLGGFGMLMAFRRKKA